MGKNSTDRCGSQPNYSQVPWDRHHIFFPKAIWGKPEFRELRGHEYCIAHMPRTAHNGIHDNQTEVVLPKNPDSVMRVATTLKENMGRTIAGKDSLAVRLEILACLFEEANEPAVADSLRKQ